MKHPIFVGRIGVMIRSLKTPYEHPRLIFNIAPHTPSVCSTYGRLEYTPSHSNSMCFNSIVFPLKDLSKLTNLTLIVGSTANDRNSFRVVILYDAVLSTFEAPNSGYFSFLNLVSGRYLINGPVALRPVYCTDLNQMATVNIFAVLFQSLDLWTWLMLALAIFMVYIYLGALRNSAMNSVFEIVEIILQRTLRKRDICRLSVLIACFFIEFIYLSGTTESIIVPRVNQKFLNLWQVLQTGHKLFFGFRGKTDDQWVIDEYLTSLNSILYPELRREGFQGSLVDVRKFWVKDTYESDYNTTNDFDVAKAFVYKTYNLVSLTPTDTDDTSKLMPSIEGLTGGMLLSVPVSSKRSCYVIDKSYNKALEFYFIYSSRSQDLLAKFSCILHESGLGKRWSGFMEDYRQRHIPKHEKPPLAQIQLNDIRTLAVFGLLSVGLIIATTTCVAECLRRTSTQLFLQVLLNLLRKIEALYVRVWILVRRIKKWHKLQRKNIVIHVSSNG